MEYREWVDYTDGLDSPYPIRRWGTETVNIERCDDGHFSLTAHGEDLSLDDDLVLEIYHLLGFYLAHQAGSVGRCYDVAA